MTGGFVVVLGFGVGWVGRVRSSLLSRQASAAPSAPAMAPPSGGIAHPPARAEGPRCFGVGVLAALSCSSLWVGVCWRGRPTTGQLRIERAGEGGTCCMIIYCKCS
jgi:hypothetical protein